MLLGPSGSGKSTLLNIIGAIESADEGYIAINKELASKQISFLLSFPAVSNRELQ